MRYQIWWGISDNDRSMVYNDCKNDVESDDLQYEMEEALVAAKEEAIEDVENGGSHYRPFVLVMAEIDETMINKGDAQ